MTTDTVTAPHEKWSSANARRPARPCWAKQFYHILSLQLKNTDVQMIPMWSPPHLTSPSTRNNATTHHPNLSKSTCPQSMQTMREDSRHPAAIADVVCHQQIIQMTIDSLKWHLHWNKIIPTWSIIVLATEEHSLHTLTHEQTMDSDNT